MSMQKKPAYTLHKGTGQARCRVNGRDHYLGRYGSPESRSRYDDLVREWFSRCGDVGRLVLTIDDIVLQYMQFVAQHYLKGGEATSEVAVIQQALRPLIRLFGNSKAREFGPKSLKAVRSEMIEAGVVRTSINRHMGRIRRMFKWAVSEELLPVETHTALQSLSGLLAGRTSAKESAGVKPVPQACVAAVEPFVSRQVWAMIQLQRLTGARPGEIVSMRTCDLNTSGSIWEYVPGSHKTEHHGKRRIIFIGPRAQNVLKAFLSLDLAAYLFSPAESLTEHRLQLRTERLTPLTPSQRARTRKKNPTKQPGDQYSVLSYGRAIATACQRADREAHQQNLDVAADVVLVPHWHPHQLRHNAATELRREFGIEVARAVLGHSSIVTSELYAELDDSKARDAIARIG